MINRAVNRLAQVGVRRKILKIIPEIVRQVWKTGNRRKRDMI